MWENDWRSVEKASKIKFYLIIDPFKIIIHLVLNTNTSNEYIDIKICKYLKNIIFFWLATY